MKPAPNATKCSIRTSSRAARRVTASAPTTLPSAAMRAYPSALDTGEQVIARVAGRILEHFREQPLEGLPHFRPGPDARRQEVVALQHEVLYGEGRLDDLREGGAGSGTCRKQDEQVVGILTHL